MGFRKLQRRCCSFINPKNLICGDGSLTVKVAQILGAQQVHGVDQVDEALNEAKNKAIKTARVD